MPDASDDRLLGCAANQLLQVCPHGNLQSNQNLDAIAGHRAKRFPAVTVLSRTWDDNRCDAGFHRQPRGSGSQLVTSCDRSPHSESLKISVPDFTGWATTPPAAERRPPDSLRASHQQQCRAAGRSARQVYRRSTHSRARRELCRNNRIQTGRLVQSWWATKIQHHSKIAAGAATVIVSKHSLGKSR